MNNKGKIKFRIIFYFILFSIIAGVIGYMLWKKFTHVDPLTINEWLKDTAEAKKNPNDKIYISDLKINEWMREISYTFHDGKGDSISKTLVMPKQYIEDFGQNLPTFVNEDYFKFDGKSHANILMNPYPSDSTPLWQKILGIVGPMILYILIFVGIYWFLIRKGMNNMVGGIGDNKNPAQKIKSDKTFKDIAGNKEAIEEIKEIVDYLKNPKKYETAGARMPHGILLGGPPGTGKTLLAKATAGEADVPFYFISASNFVEMYVGLGAKRVRTVVEEARKNAPAIIFIDELDAIGRTRGSGIGGGHDEREQTLNQLLVEMDGMKENTGLLFFAATNRTDVLDPALTRPGRFDRSVTVGLPDVKERQEILELHAKGKRLAPNIDLANVAKRTPGYSGAQLENVINEASLLAVRGDSSIISREDIDEGIDRVMAGPAKKNRVISKEELTMVAYHEAGHAVVGIKVPGGNKVQKITIIPRGQAGGYNLMTPEEEKYNMNKNELVAMITSFMGGRASEQIIYGKDNVSTGASDDIAKATRIARKMVAEWGMSSLGPIQYEKDEGSPFLGRDGFKSAGYSGQIGHEIDTEVRKIILDAEKKAIEVINKNRELLELIKTALLEKETIVAEEIEYIAKNMKLPPKKEKEVIKESALDLDKLLEEE
ncbi:ATP-dependent zinc metalloprotease FtsH [Mycoplasma sp. Mirounga ES2805-ORL]|uniref:ATP-dependent zinc metalloprotease FtsH n=1 Tax=Mycoplasma sp. Mirounga ES2805-ORL TaxID=754514 RepID=UPI00197B1FB8|nr:ATP-dependent zinc metalloprotease FtsH [Mycoplasma sp. Mirounga ES2805-ORL]QSF13504.1 ATP-dependent zinc metalloprotease FtsH [Mycoplasma sp. Mirounga ES2805-ORL]